MGACVLEMGVYFADTGIEVHLLEEVLANSLISIDPTSRFCCAPGATPRRAKRPRRRRTSSKGPINVADANAQAFRSVHTQTFFQLGAGWGGAGLEGMG